MWQLRDIFLLLRAVCSDHKCCSHGKNNDRGSLERRDWWHLKEKVANRVKSKKKNEQNVDRKEFLSRAENWKSSGPFVSFTSSVSHCRLYILNETLNTAWLCLMTHKKPRGTVKVLTLYQWMKETKALSEIKRTEGKSDTERRRESAVIVKERVSHE